MDISLIDGYEEIINILMDEKLIKPHQRKKIDQLIRNALKEGQILDVDIRMLLEAGEYIYEDQTLVV